MIDLTIFKKSKFRSKFKLNSEELKYVVKNGELKIKEHAFSFIKKRLAPAYPDKDGKQTPFKGHPVFKAQHATATCCRSCLKKWHGIQKEKPLSENEIEYIVQYVTGWIKKSSARDHS